MSYSPQYYFSDNDFDWLPKSTLNSEAVLSTPVITQPSSFDMCSNSAAAGLHQNGSSLDDAVEWNTELRHVNATADTIGCSDFDEATAQFGEHYMDISDWLMQQPDHLRPTAASDATVGPLHYEAHVVGEYDIVPSIERDYHLASSYGAALKTPESELLPYQQPEGSHTMSASVGPMDEKTTSWHHSDVDADHDSHEEGPLSMAVTREEDAAFSFSEKKKKANAIIRQLNKETSLEKRLGQHIQVVRKGHRVCFEGICWKAPEKDTTIPTTDAAKAACVANIVTAFRNNKGCKEVATSKMFLNRWADNAAYYAAEELEHAAWDIVDAMVHIHTIGWTKKLRDQKLRDQVQKTMFCTFRERFNALVKLLTRSKRTCEDLLKSERFWTTIGNPFELDVRTSSNANSNKRKGEVLKRDTSEMEDGEKTKSSKKARF
ncbi:hypothetical protein ACEQ8H_004966 [Pleosporales sp. CAS-2024a]